MESDAQQLEADRNNCRKHHELTSYNYQEHRPAKHRVDSKEQTLMKKQITKHLMAFFLSLVMIMAMGLTAFADEGSAAETTTTTTYKLTLTGTATGHTRFLRATFQPTQKARKFCPM